MDEIRELAWQHAAGRVFPEDLPMESAEALVRGVDSSALRELAGLGRRSDPTQIRGLFEEALRELGIAVPSAEMAARRDLRHLARDLVEGRTSPSETVRSCPMDWPWTGQHEANFVAQFSFYVEFADETLFALPELEAGLASSAQDLLDDSTKNQNSPPQQGRAVQNP